MITTTLLAASLAAQVQGPLPTNAALVYSGIPGIVGNATAGVRMTSHSFTAELSADAVAVSTLSLFHNDTDKPIALTLNLPVNAQNPAIGRGYDIVFAATWDKVPLKVGPYKEEQSLTDEGVMLRTGLAWQKIIRYKPVSVVFVPKGTHALRISFVVPMGKSGLDGLQRIVAYETSGALAWKAPMDRLNLTLKFGPEVVFQAISAEPKWGWAIGDKGAFAKQEGFRPGGDSLVRFMFYPNGFNRIGGG